MTTDFRLFPYIFEDIVTQVRAKYDTVTNVKPYFEFGTYLELTKVISIKDSIDAEKYPLIWLVWEAGESLQNWQSLSSYTISPRVFICNFTSSDYSSSERYSANFVNVLFPIFEWLKYYINTNKLISSDLKFNLAEHLLWGESLGFQKDSNVLFDTLDAIEIKIDSLKINKRC